MPFDPENAFDPADPSQWARALPRIVVHPKPPPDAPPPDELVDGFTRTLEATVFEQRVTRLERAVGIPAADSGQGAQASQSPADRPHDQGAAP
jgi:hypothetical protein